MGGYLLACLRTAGGKQLHECAILIGSPMLALVATFDFASATVDKLDIDAIRERSAEVCVGVGVMHTCGQDCLNTHVVYPNRNAGGATR